MNRKAKAVQNKTRMVGICFALALLMILLSGMAMAEPSAGNLSPTTGLPTGKPYRPILVNISNSEGARPQLNLSEADIVYEFIVWGPGHTRYLALYNDQHPGMVGYTRGSRIFDMSLRQAWDCPIVHAGGQSNPGTSIVEYMSENNVKLDFSISSVRIGDQLPAEYKMTSYFERVKEKTAPHNMGVLLEKILREIWPAAKDGTPYESRLPGLSFSKTPSLGSEAADQITVRYTAQTVGGAGDIYIPMYTYNKETQLYERWYNNEKMLNEGNNVQLTISNVIVQTLPLSFYNNEMARPVVSDLGSGPIDAYIRGTRVQGTWERRSPDDPYAYFDSEDTPLELSPGKTFIQIIPESIRLDEKENRDGAFVYTVGP